MGTADVRAGLEAAASRHARSELRAFLTRHFDLIEEYLGDQHQLSMTGLTKMLCEAGVRVRGGRAPSLAAVSAAVNDIRKRRQDGRVLGQRVVRREGRLVVPARVRAPEPAGPGMSEDEARAELERFRASLPER